MLEKLLEAIVGLTNALTAHTAALGADAPKATRGKAATVAAAASSATTVAATAQTVQTAATAAASPSSVTSQQAADALVKVANEVNRETAIAILAKFGAANFPGLKPEHWTPFKAECDAALAPKPAQTGAGGLL